MAQSLALLVVGLDGSEILPRTYVDVSSSVGALQRRIEAILDKPVILVSPDAVTLVASSLVGEVGLADGSTLTAVANNTAIRLDIKNLPGAWCRISADTTMTLADLWKLLRESTSVPNVGCLIDERTSKNYRETEGTDRTLLECGFKDGTRLHITFPFRGGGLYSDYRDHGRLGRQQLRPAMRDITNSISRDGRQQFLPAMTDITNSVSWPPTVSRSDEEIAPISKKARVNVQSVAEYDVDIQDVLYREERTSLPSPEYMETQADITSKMRAILIDWLIEVHMKYRLRPETLHLTVNLIDRYLSQKSVGRRRLQLVGVVAMFIASKFEEMNPPELHDCVYITDNAYTKEDVLAMECSMLSTLRFKITVPTAAHFFELLQQANDCDEKHRAMAQYILELALLDIHMLSHTPSHIVSAALLLSNEYLCRNPVWPPTMSVQSQHPEKELRACCEELRKLLESDLAKEGRQLCAVHKKFSTSDYFSVARSLRK